MPIKASTSLAGLFTVLPNWLMTDILFSTQTVSPESSVSVETFLLSLFRWTVFLTLNHTYTPILWLR